MTAWDRFWDFWLKSCPEEEGGSLWFSEEARAERLAGMIRVLYLVVWLTITWFSRSVNSAVANRVNLGVGMLWLLSGLAFIGWLRCRPYRPSFKYVSLSADILFTAAMLFLYQYDPVGYPASLKTPVFMNFFLILGLSTLRFSAKLPLYGGLLSAALYAGLVGWLIFTGNIGFGTRDQMYTGPQVNAVFLGFNAAYLATFTGVLVILVRNTRRLVLLRLKEAEATFKERSEHARVLSTLERYFSPAVARHLLDNPPALGGKLQTATVLFADLRNFTSLSENLGPVRSVAFLNALFAKLVEIVFRHGGTLDKFLGDGMLVAFGVPEARPDDALRAVRAAAEMVRAAEVTENWTGLQLGIAINTGEVIVGNIGAPARMEFTVIGDTVNTASRLEHLNKTFRTTIILSQATYDAVRGEVEARELPATIIVGKTEPVRIYEFSGWKNSSPSPLGRGPG